MAEPALPIRVFVYGSLKRGGQYHSLHCRGYTDVTPARVLGRLYRQTSGYAMLLIPPAHALALGTADPLADARTLATWQQRSDWQPPAPTDDDWQWIEGEIFTFDDPAQRLPRLDHLEDFRPGQASLYHRVIAPAQHLRPEPVWTYVAPSQYAPPGAVRIGTSWE